MPPLDLNQAEFLFRSDALADPTLRVFRFRGREALSQSFEFTVELVSENPDLDIEAPIGQAACLTLRGRLPDGTRYQRHVHGVAEKFMQLAAGLRSSRYEVTLVPTIKPLHYTRDSRIFQKLSTPGVVQKVLREGHVSASNIHLLLHGSYEPRDYCVQYQESDLDFVQRLLEEEGIFYFFEHYDKRDVMVLSDGSHAFDSLPVYAVSRLRDRPHLFEEGLFELRAETMLRPGSAVLRDYRFKQPSLDLEASAHGDRFRQYEMYYFPGDYVDPGLGRRLATVRLEEQQCQRSRYVGQSNLRAATPGYKFHLVGHRRKDSNQEYLILGVQHEGMQSAALATEDGGELKEPVYQNVIECIPAKVKYRPPRLTPRPSISGVQTATVVGPHGEEIHCDSHGRVKVHFHWDREGRRDDSASSWIRVSQPWGGAGQGGMFIPRVGQEVVVHFLEGDPDRPLIIGRVYNGENPVPHALPAGKNITTLRSASTPGGAGFNELRFDDTAGNEEVFLHAQFNHTEIVQGNHNSTINVNETTLIVGQSDTTILSGEVNLTIGGEKSVTIGGENSFTIGGEVSLTIGGEVGTTIGGEIKTTIGGSISTTIGGAISTTVGGAINTTIGGAVNTLIGGGINTTVGGEINTLIGGGINTTIGGEISTLIGGEVNTTIGGGINTTIGGEVNTTIGGGINTTIGGEINTIIGGEVNTTIGGGINTTIGGEINTIIGGEVSTIIGGEVGLCLGSQLDIVAGDSLAMTAMSMDLTGTHIGLTGIEWSDAAIEIGTRGPEIHICAIIIMM